MNLFRKKSVLPKQRLPAKQLPPKISLFIFSNKSTKSCSFFVRVNDLTVVGVQDVAS